MTMGKNVFTLVELLAVMAIIAILASMILGITSFANRRSAEAKTETLIKQLETALEKYKAKTGYYIQQASIGWAFYLDNPLDNTNAFDFTDCIDYTQFVNTNCDTDPQGINPPGIPKRRVYVQDGFGEPLIYQCPGSHNRTSFDLYSKGFDNIRNTEDDITNW